MGHVQPRRSSNTISMRTLAYSLAVGCCMLAARAAAEQGAAHQSQAVNAKQSSRDPYVDTLEYNAFPWNFEAEHAFIYVVKPIISAPTPAPAYAGYTEQLSRMSGIQNAMLTVLKYTDSPIGPYSELLYSPGRYHTAADCGVDGLQHVARIWVDSPFSQRAGRNIWGIPKELATFDWSTGPGWVKVKVTDNKSGKLVFEAKMADVPIPRPLLSKGMQLVSAIMPGCLEAVQLPIDDNTGKTEYADVPAYSTAQKAFKSKPMRRLTAKVCFDASSSTVSKVVHSFMDADAWTGHSQEAVTLMPLALSMPAGSKATLTVPELCRPAAAAAGGSGSSGSVALSLKNKQQQQVVGSSSIAFPFLG